MIWRRSANNHLAAIGGFARQWLSWGPLDRLIVTTFLGWVWCAVWGTFGLYAAMSSGSAAIFGFFLFLVCPIPWLLWLLDAYLDSSTVKDDVAALAKQGAILATRCEYLGGHPELPHGRFIYLTLEGSRQNPSLNILFPTTDTSAPAAVNATKTIDGERFALPVLDLGKMKTEKGSDASLAADLVTAVNAKAAGMFRSERLTFVVNYDGSGGRQHKVEFTNFFQGNNQIRNWQNYLVCAQAQADSGTEPHGPWVALPDDPTPTSDVLKTTKELELSGAHSGNGHEERKPSSAFVRR